MSSSDIVKVKAPCSSANLGSGFDVFGLALDAFHDVLTVERAEKGVSIEVKGQDSQMIPSDPMKNTAGVVAREMLKGREDGVKIILEKGVPPKKGLGSSGASAAAAAVAINYLFDMKLAPEDLVKLASKGEMVSAGSSHADNVAASILGGFTMVYMWNDELKVVRLEPPPNLEVVLAMPRIEAPEMKTAIARSILPKTVPLENVVSNVRNACLVVAGFHFGDIHMIGKGMNDTIVEPARMNLIPNYKAVRRAAVEAGAAGVAISGAGPTVIAIMDKTKVLAKEVAKAMEDAFLEAGIECETVSCKASLEGTTRIS
ncbi:MAG: homoserine kinase [Nitrososphaerota archaeon]|nr:homoserine kinase [Candidatus Bathyarchaeota archaeon]MDW8048145.1 homoserine kinase [Nitrososphaerota archaeon]